MSMVPLGASVITQAIIAPHLTHRRGIYVIYPGMTPSPTYVITNDQVSSYPFDSYRENRSLHRRTTEEGVYQSI
jgi:hypothetical protein